MVRMVATAARTTTSTSTTSFEEMRFRIEEA